MGHYQSSLKREVHSDKGLSQETTTKKSQINNLTLHLKELGKKEQTKPNVGKRTEIIKISVEINEID